MGDVAGPHRGGSVRQSDIEKEMVELGRSRYWSAVNKARDLGIESTTLPGQRLLSEAVELMGEAVRLWLKEAKDKPGKLHRAHPYLEQLHPEVVAAITARCILDSISLHRKILSTSIHVARLLEDEVKFRWLKEEEPSLWRQINRTMDRHRSYETKAKFIKSTAKYHEIEFDGWPKKESVSVGMICIELLRQSTGIIEIATRTDTRGRQSTMVRPTEELLGWIKESHGKSEILKPVLLPMVEPPRDWGPQREGGYLNSSFRNRGLVKTRNKSYAEELTLLDMPKVYNAVNTFQRTGYVVEPKLVGVMKYFWETGLAAGGLPSMEDRPLPTKPLDIDTDEDKRRVWRKAAARIHFENERQQSKRLQVAKVLYLADRFGDAPLWYPGQLCFRGRYYPLPYFLQPQGPDWSKALLRFHRGVPITDDNGAAWLATHVANMWGHDKLSFNDRVRWVEENDAKLQRIAADPFRHMEWTEADEPWHFLSSALEWSAFLEHGKGFVSNLPVAQDATTQGLQIYAKLLLDPVAGLATNCLPRDTPGDPYRDIADTVIQKLETVVKDKLRESDHEYAAKWLAFGITRKTTKRQGMTLTYGSVFYSCKEYTNEWFYECLAEGRENPFGEETYRPCHFLAELIWESIGEVVKSARVGMDWLRLVATICMDNDVAIQWVTPNGFLVRMDYPHMGKCDVQTTIGPVVRKHRLRYPLDRKNRRKNINAMCANYIHSLDGVGGLLGEIVELCSQQEIKDILPVHDSGSVHAQHAGTFAGCVRQAAVTMFTPDLLKDLWQQLTLQLPSGVHLPEPPTRGNMDLTQLLDSPYYWN